MRHRRSRAAGARFRLASAVAALVFAPRFGVDQGTNAREGALFLLIPVGAKAVGMGTAVVAGEEGSEGVFWNPASLARLTKPELAFSHYQSLVVSSGDALVFVLPRGRAGVVSASAYFINYGQQELTDEFGTVGTLSPSSLVVSASYAATLGTRLNAGISYKYLIDQRGCSGPCSNINTDPAPTSAFDFGVQYVADKDGHWRIGAAIRNLGFRLQINDVEQADVLPARLHVGTQYKLRSVELALPGAELHLSGELVDRPSLGDPSVHVGAELGYKGQFFLRTGYIHASGGATADGSFSIGLGIQRGGISVDFARSSGGISADAGSPPTYVTLRFRF